jgi:hypothetical protein
MCGKKEKKGGLGRRQSRDSSIFIRTRDVTCIPLDRKGRVYCRRAE